MGIIQDKVTPEFKKWVGYCEKNKKSQIGTYDSPEDYKKHAGTGNYTVFAELYRSKTGINVQGQPWCDSFIDTVFIHLFGVDKARALLGGFSAYTPTSANYYKQMGRYHKEPQEGDQIFFHNGTRIYHTGYVYSVKDGIVYTVEGNTSSSKILENEGGCVAYKQYPIGWTSGKKRIDGYGRPNYSLVETYQEGFVLAADGKRWWYQNKDGSYPVNAWAYLTEQTSGSSGWYLFDSNGYMLTGYQTAPDGKKYFLCPEGIHEGQCMVTNDQGELMITEYDTVARRYLIS
jgi:hypothetical protein